MTRYILLILIIFPLLAGSCSSRKNKLDHTEMIPENDLVSILIDAYIADGLLGVPVVHHWFSSLDSLTTYYQIIEKYGYSKETMDNTMKYYFIKKPKKLIKIYDQVLGVLSERESYLEKEVILEQARIRNLWKGPDSFSFEGASDNYLSKVNVNLTSPGLYTFSFTATLFPDDQSLNPRLTVWSCNADSIETGKKHPLQTLRYIKDGQPHDYTLIVKVPLHTSSIFSGLLYDFDNNPADLQQHAIIENISLVYSSFQI